MCIHDLVEWLLKHAFKRLMVCDHEEVVEAKQEVVALMDGPLHGEGLQLGHGVAHLSWDEGPPSTLYEVNLALTISLKKSIAKSMESRGIRD